MELVSLVRASARPVAERAAVLNAAYVDYFVSLRVTAEQMGVMDDLYDVDLERSVVALAGESAIGLANLSRRRDRGWISAVGVAPQWRRKGIAREIVLWLVGAARDAGVRTALLEVIGENEPARRLYADLGFETVRELLTWRYPADGGPLPIPAEQLIERPADELLAYFSAWHEQPPSWQRDEPTLAKMAGRSRGYRLDMDGSPAAYCLVADRGENVSILDVGVNPQFGPVRAGRVLLQALWFVYRGRPLTIMNVPADDGLSRALAALHFLVTIRQWEMKLEL